MNTDYFPICFFFSLIFLSIQTLAQTNGTIPIGSSLTATTNSSPWLSPSGDFAFGFQSIQPNALFVLSIWYNKIPQKTIVWYPIPSNLVPSGSKVELDAQLGLVLTDPHGNQLWSSAIKLGTSTTVDHGFINDTGNFLLLGPDSSSLWESFENPTDTLLPTQTMEIGGVLNSQKSQGNFSQGRFQFRFPEDGTKDGNAVLNTRNENNNLEYGVYYSSNTIDSLNSSNSGRQVIFEENGHMFVVKRSGERVDLTSQLETRTRDYYYRATLDFDGVFVIYRHPKGSDIEQNWTAIWLQPDNICSAITNDKGIGACGFNTICKLDISRRPNCECPQGYLLLDSNDKYGSCKPSFVESCNANQTNLGEDVYGLVELDKTDWPLNDYERLEIGEDDCRKSCLNDCFCAVAVRNDGFCFKKRLPLSNGRINDLMNGTAFLKIKKGDLPNKDPNSPNQIPGPRKNNSSLIILGSILLGSSVFFNFLLLCVGLFGFFQIYKKKTAKPILGNNLAETNLRGFSYEELVEATNAFNEELGRGAFGIVYKGIIDIGGSRSYVAVKKLNRMAQDTEKEFRAEVSIIGHTHHKNLVRLVGFCDQGDNRLLVYEYMSNGALASFLFNTTKPSWNLRCQIALGIARGILYLHEECSTQIIHCDIKPQNVLLDEYYNVRISDFGLAKLLMIDQSQTNTAIRGTKGYVAPEWFRNNPVTVKVDVYSFGVLLLEIVTCRKSVVVLSGGDGNREILIDRVWDCFQEGRLKVLVKNDMEALNDMKVVERFVMVGIWCIQEDPHLRPNMRKVSQMLEGVVQVTSPPCPWPFSSISVELKN